MMAAPVDNGGLGLDELFRGISKVSGEVRVSDLSLNSRRVTPGCLYLACQGSRHHGLEFLEEALERGASAVAWEPAEGLAPPALPANISGLSVPGLAQHAGTIAHRFFGRPSEDMVVTGITGTNGKTTVAWLCTGASERLGQTAAYMGTLGYGPLDDLAPAHLTTPDCVSVHRHLAVFRDAGAHCAFVELSSHGLDQGRAAGVCLEAGAFTNLSRDHLDYHGDMAAYARAKDRLFLDFRPARAIMNLDDSHVGELAGQLHAAGTQVIGVTQDSSRDGLNWEILGARPAGLDLTLRFRGAQAQITSGLLGEFNAGNLAMAAGILLSAGHGLPDVAAALEGISAPPGRMQRVPSGHGPTVIVDFAHTPDGLRLALEAAKSHSAGQVWCVFGCGGDRDSGKRGPMGQAASECADRLVITDDNPRSEDSLRIIDDILGGVLPDNPVDVIQDRAAAIAYAIKTAGADDVILIAGKGHETHQILNDRSVPFSDLRLARQLLGLGA